MKAPSTACRILFTFAVILNGSALAEDQHAVRVELHQQDGAWQLLRDGKPYFVQGGGGRGSLKALVAAGGNSVRTWGVDRIGPLLDEAQALGVSVTVGIWLGQPRHGFNYNSARQVENQKEQVRKAILKYKDHPAVLMWGLGNEMEVGHEEDAVLWLAINDLAALAHKLDPNHPTMTVFAEIDARKVQSVHKLCPEIDIVGINSYSTVASVPKRYKEAGGVKPYIMAEFGPPGSWETPRNAFGSAVELTSTKKAEIYADAWRQAVAAHKDNCLGGYAFIWGNKQEYTATWFGMFAPDGTRLGAVDAMTELWSGKPPANRCPAIKSLRIEGTDDVDPAATVQATLDASDPESDPITVKWVLQSEQKKFGAGGDKEPVPPVFAETIIQSSEKSAKVKLPKEPGSYRLFVFVTDDHGGGATANVPLRVKGPAGAGKAK